MIQIVVLNKIKNIGLIIYIFYYLLKVLILIYIFITLHHRAICNKLKQNKIRIYVQNA